MKSCFFGKKNIESNQKLCLFATTVHVTVSPCKSEVQEGVDFQEGGKGEREALLFMPLC